MANEDQRAAWNGASGANWVDQRERYDQTMEPWAALLDSAAGVAPGEHVLDVGCGCGATTLDAARRAAGGDGRGGALGVDLSAPMIDVARRRAAEAGLAAAAFRVADAQTDDLGVEEHDVVMSRFGVMFFDDPVAAFANIRTAVRPGGRLAFLVWGPLHEQTWLTVPMAAALPHLPPSGEMMAGPEDAPGIFGLARPGRAAGLLARAGWDDVAAEHHERAVLFGGRGTVVDEAVAFLATTGPARALLEGVDDATVARALDAVREVLAEHVTPDGVVLGSTAWLVTARR